MCTDLLHEIAAMPEVTGAGGGNSTVEVRLGKHLWLCLLMIVFFRPS